MQLIASQLSVMTGTSLVLCESYKIHLHLHLYISLIILHVTYGVYLIKIKIIV